MPILFSGAPPGKCNNLFFCKTIEKYLRMEVGVHLLKYKIFLIVNINFFVNKLF